MSENFKETCALVLRGHAGDGTVADSGPLTFAQGRQHVIHWAPGTVDNEFMGKKKSKCCCIYEKPREWDDPSSSSSSSDSDDDDSGPSKPKKCTEHCRGHTKHCFTKKAAAKQRAAQSTTSQVEQEQPPRPPSPPRQPDQNV
ncbi:unnamed protein product [Mesocestoides corti]|uniref:E3 ubiquitin-protein ligase PPP1R11 n=1 Tax=Mesocestoides corti TaxID=53468 RepID=A0A0R3UJR6_MESCO|nr:unnamed protein product [Mesocestoides corti]